MRNILSDRYLNDGIPSVKLNKIQKDYLKIFKDKCDKEIYEKEDYQCECGNETEFEVLGEKDRYGLAVRTVICPKCGMVMTNPRMTKDSYDRFYESEYPYIYRAIKKPDDKYFNRRVEEGHRLANLIESVRPTGKNVLEIGCAGGGIVEAFTERGYNAFGVDLSAEYVDFGKHKGINLRCCHSSELVKEGKTYDIIILNHVLEHFIDLRQELGIVHKLLDRQKGVLFVAVPGIKNLLFSYDNDFLLFLQNAHIYHFTKDTLQQVMKWNGFDAIYSNEKVEAIFCMGEKVQNVNNYYSDIKSFLVQLEADRKDRKNEFRLRCERIMQDISKYGKAEVAIYGTGREAEKLLDEIGNPSQMQGFLTKDLLEEGHYMGYPILDIEKLDNVKCIIIASKIYKEVIYERIKYLEDYGITIIQMYE